jgi:hypothetical protein
MWDCCCEILPISRSNVFDLFLSDTWDVTHSQSLRTEIQSKGCVSWPSITATTTTPTSSLDPASSYSIIAKTFGD